MFSRRLPYYSLQIHRNCVLKIYIGVICIAGVLTQRDSSHPGHYRFRLQHLEQQNIISNVKEDYRDNFICVLTFVHVSTRRKLQFQSEKLVGTKAEAKESAAKIAVLSLGMILIVPVIRGHTF